MTPGVIMILGGMTMTHGVMTTVTHGRMTLTHGGITDTLLLTTCFDETDDNVSLIRALGRSLMTTHFDITRILDVDVTIIISHIYPLSKDCDQGYGVKL